MTQKSFNYIAGSLFILVTALHLIRSILGWEVYVEGVFIPVGVSVALFLFVGYLAYNAFTLGTRNSKEDSPDE